MQEKLAITVLVIMLALFALVMVLYGIVKTKGEDYNQIVLSHQDYESRTIPYKRGNIIDRNGTYLALSEKVYNLIIDPNQIMDTDENYEYLEATLEALNVCFGYETAELRQLITSRKDSYYVVYEKQLSADKKEEFENYKLEKNKEYRSLPADEGGKKRITGVWFEEEYKRVYPYNELACNVIGFALKDGSGSGGVEQYYNELLTGINGREYGYLNDESNLERTVKPARNGQTLELTIDANIQKICQKYIDEWQNTVGSNVAAVIVMDPNNGEVLAMDTSTRYDLNNPYDISAYYTEEELALMDDNARADAWYKMWRNFCVNDTYEPGSPQKAFTVASAMEEGVISGNEHYECGGVLEIGGWPIRCVARSGHGPLSVTQSLMKSCNVAMMRIAQASGKDRFAKYQSIFGFGSKTGIDLPGEEDASNLIYYADNMDVTSLATNSFGQNYNCTMIQMAAGFCSLINGGSYYEPHVLRQVLNDQGAVVSKYDQRLVKETISEGTSDFIKEALYLTVSGDGGTAGAAAVEGYEVGGKTGTAQKQPRSEKNYLVSFIGFAPAYDPEVLTYVVIDTPHLEGEEQAHSRFASEIFSKIMAEVLPYLNVFPMGDTVTEEENALSELEEGINKGSTEEVSADAEEETLPEETWVSYDDEFIDSGDEDYSYPDTRSVPGETGGLSESTASDGENAAGEAGNGATGGGETGSSEAGSEGRSTEAGTQTAE